MRYPILLLLVCMIIACSNNEQVAIETKDTTTQITPPQKDSLEEKIPIEDDNDDPATCYMQLLKRDTIAIRLLQSGNNITGKLTYDNYEKDGSSGTVKGKIEGDTIKLLYSFASEGINSVMEVYFKKSGDTLLRGIGEMQTKGDTAYFVDPENVTYPPGANFRKIACEKVPGKYK